jgi:hypothetical protein
MKEGKNRSKIKLKEIIIIKVFHLIVIIIKII